MEHLNFSELLDWFWLYRHVIGPVLALMVLLILVKLWWNQVKYFALNVRYGFPGLGRVARASRKPQSPDVSYRGVTWYTSERSLCAEYHPYYNNFADKCDPDFFEKCEDYLNKTGQLGRKEKGLLLWLATFALVIFEAVGFAYVLAPFMARNVSPNAASMLAWMIAFMLSIILVPLTDKMGQQLHKNSLLSKIRLWHADARKSGKAKKLEPDSRIKIDTTHGDDEEPNYIKILNRVDCDARPTPGWKISAITVLLIAFIAVGAYIIRSNTISGLETEEVNASPFATAVNADAGSSASPFDLPQAAKNDNAGADKKAANEEAHAKLVAYKTTFVILSVIFIGVQVFGVLMGYFYSLAGKESAKASRYIQGFNNAREFVHHYRQLRDRVARDAQAKLASLQQLVEERHDTSGSELHGRTRGAFALYLDEMQEQEMATARRSATRQAAIPEPAITTPGHVPAPIAEPATPPSVPATPPAASLPHAVTATALGNETTLLAGLGDLTAWSDAELADMAAELHLPLERLQRKQRMQRQIAQARQAQASGEV
ncbi:hypothetical protein [Frateuria defendens]|uniref:hypothetical protein n=1 Tax=Frateuria defendens TaxID=2219559 RepID=UPI00066FF5E4|nr:hypothetical protein [Frateuria defendens]